MRKKTRYITLILAVLETMIMVGAVGLKAYVEAKQEQPSQTEFSAYEATFTRGDSKIKKVIVLQDNKHDQEFILVPGYGMQFRWQSKETSVINRVKHSKERQIQRQNNGADC